MKLGSRIAGLSSWMAAAILLGAFLLFQVQPVISKTILPWFGGSPAVWTTCLLFFQVVLLAGYAFAHLLTRFPQPRQQAVIHLALVAVAILTLPITPGPFWKPADGANPTWRILVLLTAKVGLPYFLLAATSPAIQSWFSRVYPDRSPYRLYSLSNVGSLGALLSYPFLVEPALTTRSQGTLWSVIFALFAICCGRLTYGLWRTRTQDVSLPADASKTTQQATAPSARQRLSWLLWPALACVLLMAVTNHLCQDLAVIPFLWIAPLSLYLLSFIICFDREAWYRRAAFSCAAALAVLVVSYLPLAGYFERYYTELGIGLKGLQWTKSVVVESVAYLVMLFLLCMVCHGELVVRKPAPRHLTSFYLSVSAGGALGGALVALLCPLVFSSFVELNIALLIGFFVAIGVAFVGFGRSWLRTASPLIRIATIAAVAMTTIVVGWGQFDGWDRERGLVRDRNFYGVLSVRERYPGNPEQHGLALFHGDTIHGYQLLEEDLRQSPTTYYVPNSGIGLVLENLRPTSPLRVGAIGLGTGTIAAYGRAGDIYRFYEINPLVVDMARQYFSFLDASAASIEIVRGDARLKLESESPQQFDVLVVDAFSGDTIPVHLITREAVQLYQRHITDDGVIAIHVSSRYVNLIPVVLEIAHDQDLPCVLIRQQESAPPKLAPSDWMLLSHNEAFLDTGVIGQRRDRTDVSQRDAGFPLWTDQYNNLLQILRPVVVGSQ